MEKPGKIAELLQRYLENKITLEEAEELMKRFGTDDQFLLDQLIVAYLDKDLTSADSEKAVPLPDHVYEGIRNRISPAVRTKKLWPDVLKKWRPAIAAAAIAAITLGTWLYYVPLSPGTDHELTTIDHDIAPGSQGATLTLANGTKIILSDASNGKLAEEAGVTITKTADGQVLYSASGAVGEAQSNTLTTANGQTFQVKLPDGSTVWLNAASSLIYPSSFAKQKKRTVQLKGEAYFQVAKDKTHPFIVQTEGQEVEVLGTEFNINSYPNESLTRTTLLEGSVKIVGSDAEVAILKPNQQAVHTAGGIKVINVEAQFFVDWKEGFFMFDNENLERIMRRVSRWYNVKAVFEDPALKSETISGTISKYKNISSLLKVLERSGIADFTLQDNILTISRKE